MKKFRVYIVETQFGCVDIDADTMEEAEDTALDELEDIEWYDGCTEVSYVVGHDEEIVVHTGET